MKKRINIMNFNLTFGDEEKPMLDYFDNIVFPAFKSNIKRPTFNDDTSYFLYDIKIEKRNIDDYILTGRIVKDTVLEIKSQLVEDEIVERDYEYPSAPYSFFCIYLKNHRMYLVKNQNGSPDIKSFKSTASYILNEFVNSHNNDTEDDIWPMPDLEIIGVPIGASIRKELQMVEKINKLTLKFFPLNGDTDFNIAIGNLSASRKDIGSKSGRVIYTSPKNKDRVGELLSETKGTVEPILEVTYPNNEREGTLTDVEFAEKIYIDISETMDAKSIETIKNRLEKAKSIQDLSGNHMQIFEKNQSKIKKLFQEQ